MQITVNGQSQDVPNQLSVAALLRHLGLGSDRLAVERNLAIVPQRDWDHVAVEEHDRFEIVHFVGGG